jgi:hypothetical protein
MEERTITAILVKLAEIETLQREQSMRNDEVHNELKVSVANIENILAGKGNGECIPYSVVKGFVKAVNTDEYWGLCGLPKRLGLSVVPLSPRYWEQSLLRDLLLSLPSILCICRKYSRSSNDYGGK